MAIPYLDGMKLESYSAQELDDTNIRGDLFRGFVGNNAPVNPINGDVWIDMLDSPKSIKAYDGSVWVNSSYNAVINDQLDSSDTNIRYTLTSFGWVGNVNNTSFSILSVKVDGQDTRISTNENNIDIMNNKVSVLENSLSMYITGTELSDSNIALKQEIATVYYNKGEITKMLGEIQTQALTQDQINQIIAGLPDADIVSNNELNSAINTVLTNSEQYTNEQITTLQISLMGIISNVDAKLESHKNTDRFFWQHRFTVDRECIIRDASGVGLKSNEAGTVTIDNPTNEFTVNDEAGGVIGITFRNTDTTYCTITINGILYYSSDGLTTGVPATIYIWLKRGDIILSTNVEKYMYTPFISDPSTVIAILQKQVTLNQNTIAALQTQLYNLNARIDNKVLDTTNSVSILNTSYEVTNTLGGRISGVGFTTLGIIGIRLISTGAVSITGESGVPLSIYDNTDLLAVGEAEPLVYDIMTGEVVIESSGMANLIFTPYKLGTSTQSTEVRTYSTITADYTNITPQSNTEYGWFADINGILVVPPSDSGNLFINGNKIEERGNIPIKKGDLIKSYYKPLLQFIPN